MKLDTDKKGINKVWKNYEAEAISFLIERGEEGSGSGDIFAHVGFKLSEIGETISRASVIFFMNRLVDDGLATYIERSGKGGFHKVYSLSERNLKAFNDMVIDKFLYALWETFPDNERIAESIKT